MEFGLFMGGYVPEALRPPTPTPSTTRLMSEVALAEVGDRTNWKYSWWTEHHFLEEYSHISANEVLHAVRARRAPSSIHIGSGIINITPPVNHPARVAERVAMLDHLVGGSVRVRHRPGFVQHRAARLRHRRPRAHQGRCSTRSSASSRRCGAPGTYSHEGRFFSMPERNVLPKPCVKPHPPMWVAAGNPWTFEKAARMGLGVLCFTGGTPEKMAPLIEIYKNAIADAEPVGEYVNDNVAVTTSFMCLEDGDEAIDWVTRSGNGYQQTLVFRYLDTFPKPPCVPTGRPRSRDPTREQMLDGRETGASIVGTPEECAEALQKWEAIGCRPADHGPVGQRLSARARWRTRSRCSATRSSPSSTPTPSTAPAATGRPRRPGSPASERGAGREHLAVRVRW